MFDPPLSTEDVVHTGGDFVPFVLISKPAEIQSNSLGCREEICVFLVLDVTQKGAGSKIPGNHEIHGPDW